MSLKTVGGGATRTDGRSDTTGLARVRGWMPRITCCVTPPVYACGNPLVLLGAKERNGYRFGAPKSGMVIAFGRQRAKWL